MSLSLAPSCYAGLVLLGLSAAGCDEQHASSPEPPTPANVATAPPADPPDDPLAKDIWQRAREIAPEMVPAAPLYRARLDAADRVQGGDRQTVLAVLQTGRCFKIFGTADEAVQDLDLILFDAADVQIQQDLSEGNRPALGAGASICPTQTGSHRIEMRVKAGAGEVGVQVYRSEP